jgi:23S rRNA (pseudouridine1915-N3)-methyltransferase
MRYTIICPSPLTNDKSIKSICDTYVKRMHSSIDIIEVKCKIAASEPANAVIEKQGKAILDILEGKQSTFVIAMDERGKIISSPDFAKVIDNAALNAQSNVYIIIGGAHGLSNNVKKRADYTLSFGKMVWPHRLVGMMILEQLYRIQCISSGHPYHKS